MSGSAKRRASPSKKVNFKTLDETLIDLENSVRDDLLNSIDEIDKYVSSGKQRSDMFQKILQATASSCQIRNERKCRKRFFASIDHEIDNNFEEICQEMLNAEDMNEISDKKYEEFEKELPCAKNSPIYLEAEKKVKKLEIKFKRALENQKSTVPDDSDDCIIVKAQEVLYDPMTRRLMERPMRNKFCGHHYDESSIPGLFYKKDLTKCPVGGCLNLGEFAEKDLVFNPELMELINKKKLEQEVDETEDSAMEVIEID